MIATSSFIEKANFAKAQAFSSTLQNELLFNLVSEWTFDEPEGTGRITKDTWGNNHGTVHGAEWVDDCVYGKCYSFDGVDDYVELLNPLPIFNKSFTINIWVYHFGGKRGILIGDYEISQGIRTNFEIYASNNVRFFWKNGDVNKTGTIKLEPNKWNLLSIVRDKTAQKVLLYINGVSEEIYSSSIVDQTAIIPHRFGRDARTGETAYKGKLDDIRIYDAVLSTAQIKQNYIAGLDSMLRKGTLSKQEYNERLEALANVDF